MSQSPADVEQTADNTPDAVASERECALWDAFRDEHFEAVEQLPLTIHRQYSLLRELDDKTRCHLDQLRPLLNEYTDKRLNHETVPRDDPTAPQPHKQGNRPLLTRIVRLSDDLVRASEEKVNIALAVNNSVERHMRLLDHAIQEVQLSLGARPGANTPSIHLPDLVVPRWSRTTRSSLSPLGNFDDVEDVAAGTSSQLQASRNKKSRGKQWNSGTTGNQTLQLTFRGVAAGPPFALNPEDFVVDSSERLYCYCQEVSFGEMIACDNPKCEREWFHLVCVGLEEPPKGKWFCDECSAKRKSRKK
ncbi:hypothetical protein AX14_010910 [Amanita brunnescens Koide BX004]|nr:hypothetical protein AX14_010910 [Amanita brunnescens Koide BX004]